MNKYFVYSLCITMSFYSVSSNQHILPLKEINRIEDQVIKHINSSSVSKSRKYYLYKMAARELLNYRYLNKSLKYFTKALNLNIKEDHSEIYLNLISISAKLNNTKQIMHYLSLTQKYYKENQHLLNQNIQDYLDYISITYLNKKTNISNKKSSYLSFIRYNKIAQKIKNKKYNEAFNEYNYQQLQEADIVSKTTYDLLNVIINKNNVKQLLCKNKLDRFPNSFSYSIKICKILTHYLQNNKIELSLLQNLKNYFKIINQDKSYLLDALKDLK